MVWLAASAATIVAIAFLAHRYKTTWQHSEPLEPKAPAKPNDTLAQRENNDGYQPSDGTTFQDDSSERPLATPRVLTSNLPIIPIVKDQPSTPAEISPTTPRNIPVDPSARRKPSQQNGHGSTPLPSTTTKQTTSLSPPRLNPPTFGTMPPPPRPSKMSAALRPPPSAASTARGPPRPAALPSASLGPPLTATSTKPSRKVLLAPGHSPLDWAALTRSPNASAVLRGSDLPSTLIRVSQSLLKTMNGRKGRPAWTSYQGRVYNLTAYLPFHPGGEGELMRAAGKDGAKLFMEIHPWVNWEGILGECCVGILVAEGETSVNQLDELD